MHQLPVLVFNYSVHCVSSLLHVECCTWTNLWPYRYSTIICIVLIERLLHISVIMRTFGTVSLAMKMKKCDFDELP